MTPALVLLRHGESVWNRANRFAGRADIDLSATGEDQARAAGARLAGVRFDAALVSPLRRAVRTAELALEATGCNAHLRGADGWKLVTVDALAERELGALTGRDKAEVEAEVGAATLASWRYDLDARPPGGATLREMIDTLEAFWRSDLQPRLDAGETVLVTAHNHSLRALRALLGDVPKTGLTSLDIPNAVPRLYAFAHGTLGQARDLA